MNILRKIALPRRLFLRGLGSAVALPLLDAMMPAFAQTTPPRRLGFVYVPNGVVVDQWFPPIDGANLALTPSLKSLEPFRDWVTVVGNLARPEDRAQDHACTGAWLTGVAPKRTDGADFLAGTSIDQIVAREVGRDTPLPSLELATEDFTATLGACIPGFSCAYMNTLSWQSPTTPLPMEIDPRSVFERMFGWEQTQAERLARMRTDRSVLDLITTELGRIRQRLGAGDRERVAAYFDHVREVERRIAQTEKQSAELASVPEAPIGIPESFEAHVELMFELLTVAFEADYTRVFTFMMNREFSMRTYPELGVPEGHHTISHNNGRSPLVEYHAKVNAYHVELFARFLARLQATPDGDGSLFDHVTLMYGAGMGDSNVHSPHPLPALITGGGAGRTPGGRHLVAAEQTPLPNLLLSLARRTGVELESFGISTGALEI